MSDTKEEFYKLRCREKDIELINKHEEIGLLKKELKKKDREIACLEKAVEFYDHETTDIIAVKAKQTLAELEKIRGGK